MKQLRTVLLATGLTLLGTAAQGAPLAPPEEPAAVLVDLKDNVSEVEIAKLMATYGLELSFNSVHSRSWKLMRVELAPGQDAERIVTALENDPRVENVEVELSYSLFWEPNDPEYKYQWHLNQVNMPAAWELSQGKGAIVAVIDTGVAYEDYKDRLGTYHQVEDLKGIHFVRGYDFVNKDEHANDDHAHGTHVAGTIAQATNNGIGVAGMAYKASIMPLKVLSGQGFGKTGDIADAIRFAADNGAHVINMSLGGPLPSKIMREAIHYAHKKGVVVVAAAGNNGQRKVGYPAAYPHTIAVSATRYDKTLTWYSNYGAEIDVAAPGGDTRVDQNNDGYPDGVLQNTIGIQDPTSEGYFLFQGTSMASPHVAGAAALVMSQGVTDPDKVEAILKSTAQKQGSEDWDEKYGYGIIDAAAAVSKAASLQRNAALFFAVLVTAGLGALGLARGLGAGFVLGLLTGSAGLLFPLQGSLGGAAELLTRGTGAWGGMLMGVDAYGSPLLLSALVPLLLVCLLWGLRRARGLLAGLSAGFAAYLFAQAYLGCVDVAVIPNWLGSTLDRAWLVLHGLLAFGLAALLARAARSR
jgi:serine protease